MSATDLYPKDEYCLANDKLDRGKQADLLVKYIKNIDKNFVMNINSPFGTGKSFFLKILEEKLEEEKGYKVININAWENDDQSPSMVFLAEIYKLFKDNTSKELDLIKDSIKFGKNFLKEGTKLALMMLLEKYFSKERVQKLLKGLGAEKLTFENVISIIQSSFEDESSLFEFEIEEYLQREEAKVKFKEKLEELTKENKIVIMIDDLDRCKPTFSLELLETIKHIFDITGIIFVLATDFDQLKHTVSRVYGEIENEGYLRKFIDREFKLLSNNDEFFKKELFKKYKLENNFYFNAIYEIKGLNLRRQEKLTLLLKEYSDIGGFYGPLMPYILIYLKVVYPKIYSEILNGEISYNNLCLSKKEVEELKRTEEYYKIYKDIVIHIAKSNCGNLVTDEKLDDYFEGYKKNEVQTEGCLKRMIEKIEFLS